MEASCQEVKNFEAHIITYSQMLCFVSADYNFQSARLNVPGTRMPEPIMGIGHWSRYQGVVHNFLLVRSCGIVLT